MSNDTDLEDAFKLSVSEHIFKIRALPRPKMRLRIYKEIIEALAKEAAIELEWCGDQKG